VTLLAGNNVNITSDANALTISATGGSGDRNSLDAADGDPTDVIFVDNDGNVGIGTTTPQAKLSLGTDLNVKKLALWDGTNDFYGFGVALGRITMYTNNTEKMTITSSGNVGVGTNGPAYRMDVVGDRLRLRNTTAGAAKEINLRTDGAAVDIDVNNADLFLKSNSGNTILQAFGGNVGIGTGNPQQKLHVAGVARFDVAGSFDVSTPGGWPGIIAMPSTNGHRRDIIFDASGIRLLTSSSSSPPAAANGIFIGENGRVGIGTQTPGAQLQITGGGIIIERDGSHPFIRFSHTYKDLPPILGAETWTLQANSPNQGSFYIRNESDNVDRLVIDGNGNVFVNGNLAHSSDQRLKHNIENIDDALDKVTKLRGVKFQWKQSANPDSEHEIGLIAQEVEAVCPELVKTGHDGYKFVAYANITAVLIEALKEQQQIIAEQNSKLERQKIELQRIKDVVLEIDDLKSKISKLESAMQNVDLFAAADKRN
jgi:hypothetical protein